MNFFLLFGYPFVQTALLAGICIAILAAVMGYFLILRGLTFAGHALPNIGFAGAAGAVLFGLPPFVGLFVFTVFGGIGISLFGKRLRERDTIISILMTLAIGLGLLFFALYNDRAIRIYSILFGSILGITVLDVWISLFALILTLIVLLIILRPLLFSSLDPEVALARGIPVRLLSIILMTLVALAVSVSIQLVGTLLVFTLLVGPAATAVRLTQRPVFAIILASCLGISYVIVGIMLAMLFETWPTSFFIASLSFLVYLPIRFLSPLWLGRKREPEMPSRPQSSPTTPREEIVSSSGS